MTVVGCGTDSSNSRSSDSSKTTEVEIVEKNIGTKGFNPTAIYRREAPGVVTVISDFNAGQKDSDDQRGLGSGFVVSAKGEIATNAHVVTTGEGRSLKRAKEVYVEFSDSNKVSAEIVGVDPDTDIALLQVKGSGLKLRPLPLGNNRSLAVGEPVAAIGSPFGEAQSLSTGVISALGRSIESLTGFAISDAVQTDAAINHGNSGGPLVDAQGRVIGVNSQIRSTSGGGEGVGFAVPVDTVKSSLRQLRKTGKANYAYLGVSTVPVYPQLADKFDLPVSEGAWIQAVQDSSPAKKAGLRAGKKSKRFQISSYRVGGDIITKIGQTPIESGADLSRAVAKYRPADRVKIEFYRDGELKTVSVKLVARPREINE